MAVIRTDLKLNDLYHFDSIANSQHFGSQSENDAKSRGEGSVYRTIDDSNVNSLSSLHANRGDKTEKSCFMKIVYLP